MSWEVTGNYKFGFNPYDITEDTDPSIHWFEFVDYERGLRKYVPIKLVPQDTE
jgi:hypothetical protein